MFSFFRGKKSSSAKTSDETVAESFEDYPQLFDYFKTLSGIHFGTKESITVEKMKNFALRHGIHRFDTLLDILRQDPGLRQQFIDLLTVNETFFFREYEQIACLCSIIKEAKQKMHILCAPTSTGEEVYSIILALEEAGIPSETYEVTGIDINASAIQRAQAGYFSERSVNRLNSTLKKRFFSEEEHGYRILPQIRQKASFYQMNIFDPEMLRLGRFDIILSRNLFIYFDEDQKQEAIRIFHRMLNPEGVIFFGHADILNPPPSLERVYADGTRYYRKV